MFKGKEHIPLLNGKIVRESVAIFSRVHLLLINYFFTLKIQLSLPETLNPTLRQLQLEFTLLLPELSGTDGAHQAHWVGLLSVGLPSLESRD